MPTIYNFGHFWEEAKVTWNLRGKDGTKGGLRGYRIRGRKTPVDLSAQIGIYVLFSPKGEVIYVGQVGSGTRTLFGRLRKHKKDHLRARWSHFSWFGLCEVTSTDKLVPYKPKIQEDRRDVLDELEAIIIHLFEPRLNIQRAKWKDTEEYLQYYIDKGVNPTEEEEEEE